MPKPGRAGFNGKLLFYVAKISAVLRKRGQIKSVCRKAKAELSYTGPNYALLKFKFVRHEFQTTALKVK